MRLGRIAVSILTLGILGGCDAPVDDTPPVLGESPASAESTVAGESPVVEGSPIVGESPVVEGSLVAEEILVLEEQPAVVGESVAVEGGQYRAISVMELQSMVAIKDFPLINVHVPFAGNLPGTDTSIPFNEIERNLNQLPADKSAKIVLYCRSGPMSETAATTLVRLGYTNVYHVVGGFAAWSAAGLPLVGQ